MRRAVAETTTAPAPDLCLRYVHCRRPAECRGLCMPDYRQINKLINEEVFTEEELIRKRRILPKQQSVKEWCEEG